MLELRGVSKSYGRTPALHGTYLALSPNKTTVLIGPSGCGKSTILRLMNGLVRPDAGTIRFEGIEVTPDSAEALRPRMGYVIQDGGLFPHLSARGNATIMARYLGWGRSRLAARLDQLTDLTRFPRDGLDRFPLQLSGGQRQRVSLMRALMLDPDVLLLDEPLGALDPLIRADLQKDLRKVFQTLRKTVVFVTHDLHEARFFGDVVVLMHEGRIVQQGTFDALLHAPAVPFVSQFINAQRSLLDGAGGQTQ